MPLLTSNSCSKEKAFLTEMRTKRRRKLSKEATTMLEKALRNVALFLYTYTNKILKQLIINH